jgi:hypothetical protein
LSEEGALDPKHEFEHDVKLDVEARVLMGLKAVLGEEMTEHLEADYRELTPSFCGELLTICSVVDPYRINGAEHTYLEELGKRS